MFEVDRTKNSTEHQYQHEAFGLFTLSLAETLLRWFEQVRFAELSAAA